VTGDEGGAVCRHIWIVGPGRLGLALGSLLLDRGVAERVSFSGRGGEPPTHPIFRSLAVGFDHPVAVAVTHPAAVLVAVNDASLPTVAAQLADLPLPAGIPVLHTSGVLGASVLEPLRSRAHPVGSLHPLVSVPDPATGEARLPGAWFGVEGDREAVSLAQRIVVALDGQVLHIDPEAKALYHAAAVMAGNFTTALIAEAEALLVRAGVEAGSARDAAAALAAGAVSSAAALGPAEALTGPIRRGDVETVRLHLSRLSPQERALYSVLARSALDLARRAGLSEEAGAALATLIEDAV
jgi:predicted short-subunit dehydrogenase-like oxidoreductase (DUF2520 family)